MTARTWRSHSRFPHHCVRHPRSGMVACLLGVGLTGNLGCAKTALPPGGPPDGPSSPGATSTAGVPGKHTVDGFSKNESLPVIWCFVGSRDAPASVRTALQSKLITHVAIFAGNRATSDTLNRPTTREAIKIVQEAKADGVELILVRYLWETRPGPHADVKTLRDVDYYVQQINRLRSESREIGATYIGLDTEPYGRTPIHAYFRDTKKFSTADFQAVVAAVDLAAKRAGKVDFVLPAGSARRHHPLIALAGLGKKRIAEGTYYDNAEHIHGIEYPYEITGMYVNVFKKNERHPWLPYFLAEGVFGDKSSFWRHKEGLMIWPREHRATEVAQTLVDLADKMRRGKGAPSHASP